MTHLSPLLLQVWLHAYRDDAGEPQFDDVREQQTARGFEHDDEAARGYAEWRSRHSASAIGTTIATGVAAVAVAPLAIVAAPFYLGYQAAFAETDAQKVQRLHEETTRKKREAEARGGGGGGGGGRARDTESRRLLDSRG